MIPVFLSLGSNRDRERNIQAAVDALSAQFEMLRISPVYESQAVGGSSGSSSLGSSSLGTYHNLVVSLQTDLPVMPLQARLRDIEHALGRDRRQPEIVPIDIDILLYGESNTNEGALRLPHPDLRRYEHLLAPLVDIAPALRDPGSGLTYADLLREATVQRTIVRRL